MEKDKKQILETKGWKFGDTSDFLKLSKKEIELIEIKLTLTIKALKNK